MRNMMQLLGGVAVAGVVATGAAAFTAVGFTNAAPATVFVGGTVSQTVTGASLSTIAYTYLNATNTSIATVTLTFADGVTDGKTPTVAFTTGAYTGGATSHSCTAINVSHVSTCTFNNSGGWLGATAVDITVA